MSATSLCPDAAADIPAGGRIGPLVADAPARIGLIHNPLARRNRRHPGRARAAVGQVPHVTFVQARGPAEIEAALQGLARAGVEVIAVNGGDGTIQATLSALLAPHAPFPEPPPLAVLAGGTTNMTARDVGATDEPGRALRRLLAWSEGRRRAELLHRAVLGVASRPNERPAYGLFFSTAGILEATLYCRHYRDSRRLALLRNGLGTSLGVARLAGSLALGGSPLSPARIHGDIDGQTLGPADYLGLLVTTLERLALGIRPYWGEGPGRLRLTAVHHRPHRLLLALPALLRGRPSRHLRSELGYRSAAAHQVHLYLEGPYAIDGEIFHPSPGEPVTITEDRQLCFLRP